MSCAPEATPVPTPTQELTRANARLSAEVVAREAAERELLRQVQLFRTLLDAIPDCIYIKDAHGRYLGHTAANCHLLALAAGDDGTGHDFPATQATAPAYTDDDRAVLASGQPVLNREELFTQPDAFALVVMDLTMPHMDGAEAIARLHRTRPAQRVVLMSGYSEHDLAVTFADRGVAGFLQKPFELPTLRDKIRRVFELPAG